MNRNPNSFGERRPASGGGPPQQHPSEPPASLPPLVVVELTPSRKPGNLRAFAAVRIGKHLTIRGWRVVEQAGQAAWASGPMQERRQEDGSLKFYPILDLPESWKKAACGAVIEAWEAYKRDGVLPGVRVIEGRAS